MNFKSKTFKKDNFFVLYDLNDDIVCYFDNFEDLSRTFSYELRNLVYQYNNHKSNIINIEIDNKKYKLATFC